VGRTSVKILKEQSGMTGRKTEERASGAWFPELEPIEASSILRFRSRAVNNAWVRDEHVSGSEFKALLPDDVGLTAMLKNAHFKDIFMEVLTQRRMRMGVGISADERHLGYAKI
jgi:hypothetical protein